MREATTASAAQTQESERLQAAKAVVRDYYCALAEVDGAGFLPVMKDFCAPDLIWRGFHPFDLQTGPEPVAQYFWAPLARALRPLRRRMDMFIAGTNWLDDGQSVWVASMGHLMGLFEGTWLGIRPTGKLTMLRYAAFHRVERGRIVEEAMYFDIPHLMVQAGQNPFPPQTGAHLVQPGPGNHHALLWDAQDPEEARRTRGAIERMLSDIRNWRVPGGPGLLEELRRSWTEDMLWWGPEGIGATYTIQGYARQHVEPFRQAFTRRSSVGHIARISEGTFGGFFGWPNLTLEPTGGFMGMPATGKLGEMRVIDMYRREGDKLAENWIFIDMLHFWKGMGLDVLARHQET